MVTVTSPPTLHDTDVAILEYNEFIEVIHQAVASSIPLKKTGIHIKPNNPWWDAECEAKLKVRKNTLNTFINNPTMENAKKTIAITKKFFKRKKKTNFKEFCHNLNRFSNISYIWNTIKKFSNQNPSSSHKSLPSKNTTLELLNKLSVVNINPEFSVILNLEDPIDPINIHELKAALRNKKDTATGLSYV